MKTSMRAQSDAIQKASLALDPASEEEYGRRLNNKIHDAMDKLEDALEICQTAMRKGAEDSYFKDVHSKITAAIKAVERAM